MNEDGDAVAGVGCNVDDNTDEDEVHCYFQAFHKSIGLANIDSRRIVDSTQHFQLDQRLLRSCSVLCGVVFYYHAADER